MKVSYNKPSLVGRELEYIKDALSRKHLSGDGYYTNQCSEILEKTLGVPKVLLTPSCTHALELAFLLIDIKPGDRVILPSFTFPSTANAFVLRGAVPTFVDIRPDTLNIDERLVEGRITSKTRVLSPVHYAGVPCQMDVLMRIAKKHRLIVVEDAAQALGAAFRGKPAGSFGHLNGFSFHETKNVMCGEGGALALNDPRYIKRGEILRQKGTNRAQFYRGEVNKYSWVDVGSSLVPSELQAAFLFAQLERRDLIRKRRQRLYERYFEELSPFQEKGKIQLPVIPGDCASSYHIFHVLFESERERDRVMEGLRRKGILAVFHYFPLHLSAMGRRFGYRRGACPVSEDVSKRLLRLPLYNSMTPKEQSFVISSLTALLRK